MKAGGIANYSGEKANKKKLLQEKAVLLSKNKVFFYIKILISMYLNRRQQEMQKVTSRANNFVINALFHKRHLKIRDSPDI